MLDVLFAALAYLADPLIYLYILLGVLVGIVFGALPGLSTILAVSILLPISFALDPIHGIPFLIGIYKGGIYGGSIPAILLGIPGTAASIVSAIEGPLLTRAGKARKALEMALYSSAIGDIISDIVTIVLIGAVAAVVLMIGPPEVFAIIVFSLVLIASVSGDSGVKGAIAACLGLALGLIGSDPATGVTRMTFGLDVLAGGIPLIPLVIGLFAVPEILASFERRAGRFVETSVAGATDGEPLRPWELWRSARTIMRSSAIGVGIGMVPGLGQATAGFVGYSAAKRAAGPQSDFGKGTLDGIAAPEAANNAVNGPTLVPLLTLGIPGDAVTAILLGAFIAHGLRPGPLLLEESGPLVYAILLSIIIANLIFVVVGYIVLKPFVRLIQLRKAALVPIIMALSVLGVLSVGGVPELLLALVIGTGGYLMRRAGFDLAPLIIAFILADSIEFTLSQSLLYARGDLAAYFFTERPAAGALLSVALVWAAYLTVSRVRRSMRASRPREPGRVTASPDIPTEERKKP